MVRLSQPAISQPNRKACQRRQTHRSIVSRPRQNLQVVRGQLSRTFMQLASSLGLCSR